MDISIRQHKLHKLCKA